MPETYQASAPQRELRLPPRGAYRVLRLEAGDSAAYDPSTKRFVPNAVGELIGLFLDAPSARTAFAQASTVEAGELCLVDCEGAVIAHASRRE